jgi:hypothetical protein
MAEVGCLKDGNFQNLQVEGSFTGRGLIPVTGVKTISVITAGDASHTLVPGDAGLVVISAALATGAVIKLPAADTNVGLYYRLLYTGTMNATSQIQLPNGGTGNFGGVVTQNRCGNVGGVADAVVVNRTTVVPGASKQSIDLDENSETFGGGIGTDLEFYYASPTEVIVTGTIHVNTASTALNGVAATMFTATGY